MLGQAITALGSDIARWATQTEKYLAQTLQQPTAGRGSKVHLYRAPLKNPRPGRKAAQPVGRKWGLG